MKYMQAESSFAPEGTKYKLRCPTAHTYHKALFTGSANFIYNNPHETPPLVAE